MVLIIRWDTDFKFRIANCESLIDPTNTVYGHLLKLDFFSLEDIIFLVIIFLIIFHVFFLVFHFRQNLLQ